MGESITCHPDFLLYQIGETQGQYGVGFIIKQHLKQYVEEFIGISERIAIMNLKLPGYKKPWSIVQIYSPTEQSNLETINNFYHNLNEAIQEHTHKNLIVMGDFNGQIGARRPGENQLEQITTALRAELKDFKENTKELKTQDKYNYIENIIKTQTKLTADTKIDSKGILSTATIKLLEERNHLINERSTQNRRQKLAKISKDINESIRKDRKQRRMQTIENYILKTGGTKKALKELTGTKNWIVKMKDDRGKFDHHRIDILKTATSYYKKLYQNNTTQAEINLVDTSNTPSILQAEVSKAIDTQKSEKAPGPDGISNEILRYSKEILLPVLTDMFNDILNTETIPQQWTKSHIILLYKKAKLVCANTTHFMSTPLPDLHTKFKLTANFFPLATLDPWENNI
ncbi:unnamed protein product [Colias eurytheme]|nr:unnamed protein product [Colias eurytheme]